MEYEQIIDELLRRGVNNPYQLVPPQGDTSHVERAIDEYDRRKAKKPDIHAGLLVWLIRNPPEKRTVEPRQIQDFKAKVKSFCLPVEGNVRWAIEESMGKQAFRLGLNIKEVINEVMWPGWEETPPHPEWLGVATDKERDESVRFWRAIARREGIEVRDQAGMGEEFRATGLPPEGSNEGDERTSQDQ